MTEQHDRADGCFFCASDEELGRAMTGDIRRTIHMSLPESACPYWATSAAVDVSETGGAS